ncbi:MAG: MinD/ParA family protein [Lachnospiraceae bacterium]|nr:MinD/ParA family protein [Lachnospiraceae bacterium]
MDQAEGLRNIIKKQEIEPASQTARVITVTSGKGGVGKTSVSINLAIQLARQGKRVVVLDADFGLANIEIMLGIRPKYNLADLMFRGKSIQDIITYGPEGIGFISGGSGINEMANLTREQVFQLIQKMYELDQLADVIIVDTGAGIGDSVLEFVAASTEVLLVATPEPTSITDAYALLKSLNRNSSYKRGKTMLKMIANQVRNDGDADELFEKIGVVVNKFLHIEIEYLGAIPYDENMQKAVMSQEPLSLTAPNSAAARSLYRIAGILENKEIEDIGDGYGIMQFFSRVIRMKFNR